MSLSKKYFYGCILPIGHRGWAGFRQIGKSGRFKAGSGRGIGFVPDGPAAFFVHGNRGTTVYGNLRRIEV